VCPPRGNKQFPREIGAKPVSHWEGPPEEEANPKTQGPQRKKGPPKGVKRFPKENLKEIPKT